MKIALISLLLVFSLSAFSQEECRQNIADIICLVDPVDENNPFANLYNRPCLPTEAKYVSLFQRHFDHARPLIQKMYCTLEKIWIEKEMGVAGPR
jgi:hypothetical protein